MNTARQTLIAAVAGVAGLSLFHQAQAREVRPETASRLLQDGTILPLDALNQTALADHPRGAIRETGLEARDDRYLYQVKLRDARGVRWRVDLNARNGAIIDQKREP